MFVGPESCRIHPEPDWCSCSLRKGICAQESLQRSCTAAARCRLWWLSDNRWEPTVCSGSGSGRCVASVQRRTEEEEYVLVVGLICRWGTGAAASGHRHNKAYVTQRPRPSSTSQDSGKRLIRTENLCHQFAFTSAVSFPVKGSVKPRLLALSFFSPSFKRYEFMLAALVWPAADSDATESDLDLRPLSKSELKHSEDLINSRLAVNCGIYGAQMNLFGL